MIDNDWHLSALCAQTDPEAFFPAKGGSTREAKRICMGCDVKEPCLQEALDHDERYGIRGGYSERERRRLQRGQRANGQHRRANGHGYACKCPTCQELRAAS